MTIFDIDFQYFNIKEVNRIKNIKLKMLFFSALFFLALFYNKCLASDPALFKIDGKAEIKQGETVTYNLVVTSGSALLIDGDFSLFSGNDIKNTFDYVSFSSKIGATYEADEDALYLHDEDGYAVPVKAGDVIGTFTLKIKNNASTGNIVWQEGSQLEKTLTVTATNSNNNNNNSSNNNDENDNSTNNILIGVIIGMGIIIVGLVGYVIGTHKKQNI